MAKAKINDTKMEWFPCYAGNLLGALAGMPSEQQLIYTVVLLRIYEAWGPCKDTAVSLARRTGLTKRKTEDALASLFESGRLVETAEGITSPKADTVMADQDAFSKRLRERASTAAKKRWKKIERNQQNGHASAMLGDADKREKKDSRSPTENGPRGLFEDAENDRLPVKQEAPDARVYRRGREVLGRSAGGLVRKLIEHHGHNYALAIADLEKASTKSNPREWVCGVLKSNGRAARSSRNGFAALMVAQLEQQQEEEHNGPAFDIDANVSTGGDADLVPVPILAHHGRPK